MIIIIDAYNVLKQVLHNKEITDKQRNKFIDQLVYYAQIKKHKVKIVFDGGPYEWPHKEQIKNITIIYSGFNESADDFITQYLEDHQTKEVLLVSTDREINAVAEQFEIPSIDSLDFYQLLQHALHKDDAEEKIEENYVIKISKDSFENIDKIMMEASEYVPVKKEDRDMQLYNRVSSSYTEGKQNKKLLRILKKL